METITALKALIDYFNEGAGKRPMKDWAAEVKALTPAEKQELAAGAAKALSKQLV
jgi:hypothetical protein